MSGKTQVFPLADILSVVAAGTTYPIDRESVEGVYRLCSFLLKRHSDRKTASQDWLECRGLVLAQHPELGVVKILEGANEAWIADVAEELGYDQVVLRQP